MMMTETNAVLAPVFTPTAEERAGHLLKLRDLIEKIPVCMVTTLALNGSIHSRPMAYLHMEDDAHLMFLTRAASTKALEVKRNRQVNLSFCDTSRSLYVSVSGRARIVNDRDAIANLFTPILKQWFPNGATDPTLRLFDVDPHAAEYWDGPSGLTLLLAFLKGETGELGEHDFFEL